MRTVWKYEIPVGSGATPIEMPQWATLLPVADCPGAGEFVAIWALVEPSERRVVRTFNICGTGQPTPILGRYVATAICRSTDEWQMIRSPLVWHVFEVTS